MTESTDVRDVAPSGDASPVDLRDYVDFSQAQATRVRVLATNRIAQDLWCIEPQQATPVLQYDHTDVVYTVIGGRSWFVTEQGEIGLDPLGALLVPAGVVHGIDNRGVDPLIVSAASSPAETLAVDRPVSTESLAIREDDTTPSSLREAFGRILGKRGPE